jgi:hypothetical protein
MGQIDPADSIIYKNVADWQQPGPAVNGRTVWYLHAARKEVRAARFPLQLSVRFRPVGQLEWHTAETANVSASGVLVQASNAPQVDTPLEFRLMLTPRRSAARHGEVSGRGHVVRQVSPAQGDLYGFALAIDNCDFLPVNHVLPA